MSPSRQVLPDAPDSWEDESQEQAQIQQQLDVPAEPTPVSAPADSDVVETEKVEQVTEEAPPVQYVTLVPASDVDINYPLRVSLVGLEDEIVFEDADGSAQVTPPVAEQVRYLDNVEVAA